MGKTRNLMTKLSAVVVLAGLGMVHVAKADSYSETSTFYYAGPETGTTDNPFSITNVGGNLASTMNLTNAGSTGTLSINTVTNPAISLTGSQFTVTLYGVPNGLLNGSGQLVTGTYNFNSASDYFGIESAGNGAVTGFYGSPAVACNTGQICNGTADPIDQVTLNVAANGVVTLQSSSLELVTKVSSVAGVPEIDPSSALSPLALLGCAVMIFRGRRRLA
jgi:hypothetical protein